MKPRDRKLLASVSAARRPTGRASGNSLIRVANGESSSASTTWAGIVELRRSPA